MSNGRLNDGRFGPGNPGRPPGTNKLREKVKQFIDHKMEDLPGWFDSLTPKEKINVVTDLLPYALPRLQANAVITEEVKPVGVNIQNLSEETLHKILEIANDVH